MLRPARRNPASSLSHTGAPSSPNASAAVGSSSSGKTTPISLHGRRLIDRVELDLAAEVAVGEALRDVVKADETPSPAL